MSLKEAVLEIVERMEETARENPDVAVVSLLTYFSGQLRLVCKAVSDNSEHAVAFRDPRIFLPSHSIMRDITQQVESEKEEGKKRSRNEEVAATDFVELIGGPANQEGVFTQFEIPSSMPVGGKMLINGGVYILTQDRELLYSEKDTLEIIEIQRAKG